MKPKWVKLRGLYFKNKNTNHEPVLQVISPSTGKITYYPWVDKKTLPKINKIGQEVWVFFDKRGNIQRITKFYPILTSLKQNQKILRSIKDSI